MRKRWRRWAVAAFLTFAVAIHWTGRASWIGPPCPGYGMRFKSDGTYNLCVYWFQGRLTLVLVPIGKEETDDRVRDWVAVDLWNNN